MTKNLISKMKKDYDITPQGFTLLRDGPDNKVFVLKTPKFTNQT